MVVVGNYRNRARIAQKAAAAIPLQRQDHRRRNSPPIACSIADISETRRPALPRSARPNCRRRSVSAAHRKRRRAPPMPRDLARRIDIGVEFPQDKRLSPFPAAYGLTRRARGLCHICGAASCKLNRGEFARRARTGRLRWQFQRHVRCAARCSALGMAALAGCGMSDGPGSLLVDPGRYSAYHCNDLAARWKILVAREKDLRGLMDKANESSRRRGDRLARLPHRLRFRAERRKAFAAHGGGKKLQLHDRISERPEHSLITAHAGVPASAAHSA